MTDRELLELAAKAAGHRIVEWVQDDNKVDIAIIIRGDGDGFSKRPWQPLLENQMTDADGDALRLAAKLGLQVDCSRPSAGEPYKPHAIWLDEICDNGTLTRRAIVLAASIIGRNMP